MQWQQTEFILKGVYLGLLLFVALREPTWEQLGYVGLCTLGGLLLFLLIAAFRKLREGYRARGKWLAFMLFLLLEHPGLVYGGILLGLMVGAYTLPARPAAETASDALLTRENWELLATVGGGAVLGILFWILRHVRDRRQRLILSLGLGVVLVAVAVLLFQYQPHLLVQQQWQMLGALLLLGIPPFYLLTFASLVEESEIEIAAICAALGIGLWIVGEKVSPTFQALGLVLPAALYYTYTRYVLPGLRVFKHVLRGVSYASVGRYRWALISLGRAVQLNPSNVLAREALWSVHRDMDFQEISHDPDTLALVNFEMCLERAGSLLLQPPRPEQLQEANRLLNFVAQQHPEMLPRVAYWRAVAHIHQRQYDEAAQALETVLAGSAGELSPHRQAIQLSAWQLALGHPEMRQRVGLPQLQQPGQRMAAIAAVERQLTQKPDDAAAAELKKSLYHDLREAEYNAAVPPGQAAVEFDHAHAQELGTALLSDPAHWQRGAEYLRLAARGLPQVGPSIFVQIARTSEKNGDIAGAWRHYELARDAGRTAGPAQLSEKDRSIYFQVVKMLADSARDQGALDKAIENYRLYTEAGQGERETYRALADLYERKGDIWSAVHCTEHGLTYDSSDKDFVERKDRYYYSITPDDLRANREAVQKWFDAGYCSRKARWLLDKQGTDPEILDWAGHLLELAQIMQPENLTVRMLRGRVRRLRGELPEAISLLEEVRAGKPESFANSDEEEAWYTACKLLGDMYLHEQPEKALECFLIYRQSPRSGGDTWYKMGVAYEALGQQDKAIRCYEQVVAFERHPLAPDARLALDRLKRAS